MSNRLILVAGNIGAGKTTITERLGERLNWQTGYESVADNPYLSEFYGDMKRWAFHLQVFFLGHRAEQHIAAAEAPTSAVLDRSIYEDFYIFTRALYKLGNMSERDYFAFRKVYDLVTQSLPTPDLLIYVKAPVSVLLNRINARGREMESGITAEYLELLDSLYDEWLTNFNLCPVLTVQSNDLNFAHKPEHVEIVVQKVQEKLSGRDELFLGN